MTEIRDDAFWEREKAIMEANGYDTSKILTDGYNREGNVVTYRELIMVDQQGVHSFEQTVTLTEGDLT